MGDVGLSTLLSPAQGLGSLPILRSASERAGVAGSGFWALRVAFGNATWACYIDLCLCRLIFLITNVLWFHVDSFFEDAASMDPNVRLLSFLVASLQSPSIFLDTPSCSSEISATRRSAQLGSCQRKRVATHFSRGQRPGDVRTSGPTLA